MYNEMYPELDNPSNSISNSSVIDEYALTELNLITPELSISLKAVMIELSYYEDIFNCSTSGHVLIKDSNSLIDKLNLCGNEFIKLTFKRSPKSKDEYSRYFRVYRVSERIQNNNFTETYSLHFCSEELFLSEQIKISKSYKNKQISFIIKDVLNSYLKIPEKRINIDNSNGLYDIIIPFKKPFEAINWMTNLAQPLGKEGADFLFFENQDGFNFLSLQKLFEKPIYSRYSYSVNNAGLISGFNGAATSDELSRSLSSIKTYKFIDTFDSLYGVVTGAFANRTLVIDPITRQYKDVKFDYKKYFDMSANLNDSPVIGYVKNRVGKYPYENYDSVYKVVQSNTRQKNAAWLKEKPTEVANDIMAEVFVPYRTAQLALSTYSRVRLTMTGDPNISVGKVIEVNLPSNESNSGKYLITSVRHIIDAKMRYEVVVEVAKNSFSKKFPSNENNSEYVKAKKGEK